MRHLFFIAFILQISLSQDLIINESMSKNNNAVYDEDGDTPDFAWIAPSRQSREGVLYFPHHGRSHLDRPIQRAEQSQKGAHEIKRTRPLQGRLHELRLQVQQIVAVRNLVRRAKYFGSTSHKNRTEK